MKLGQVWLHSNKVSEVHSQENLFDKGERVNPHADVLSTRHAILPNVTSQNNVCVGD